MPLYKAAPLFKDAIEKNYSLAAFNISSIDSLQAILWAAEAEKSPVIVQVLHFAEKYARDVETYLKAVRVYLEASKIPVLFQHDHCSTVEEALRAIDRGFDAVMFDGSALPYEENVRQTKQVVEYAHERDVWVEAELGSIPGLDDLSFADHVQYTDADMAVRFIEETGCDALAVSVGTAHGGVPGDDYLPFEFDMLEKLRSRRPDYPFVLHGAASMPDSLQTYVNLYGGAIPPTHICSEQDIAKACRSGVHKVNMDVDSWLAYTGALRQFFSETPEKYFPFEYLDFARNAWEQEVRHKFRNVVGSSGMADNF